MPYASDTRLLVLHGLRLKGFGEPDAVGAIVGVDGDDVAKHLEALREEGLVLRREGSRLSGWGLTIEGRAEQERLLAEELDDAGVRPVVQGAYSSFLECNTSLLEICTAWQMKDETTLNDHADSSYDASVIERLVVLDSGLRPVLERLESVLERYSPYALRFEHALERLKAGDPDWFTKPLIDSYHTVWFQLHEDLLNTLGLDRASEAGAGSDASEVSA